MKRITLRRCRCCKEFFSPDYRNVKAQVFCGKPECRKASKNVGGGTPLQKCVTVIEPKEICLLEERLPSDFPVATSTSCLDKRE